MWWQFYWVQLERRATMRIFILRHGHYNGDSLSELGHRQAEIAASTFAGLGLDKDTAIILSSPLTRTRETAQIIADKLKCGEVGLRDWLCDECHTQRELQKLLSNLTISHPNLGAIICVSHAPPIDELTEYRFDITYCRVFEIDFMNKNSRVVE